MASLIDELIDVLADENKEYQSLLKLSQEKTPVIVEGDVDKLQEITNIEQKHMTQILKDEKKREELVDDMATVLNLDRKKVTVKILIDVLKGQPKDQKRLAEVHAELKSTLKNFGVINERNQLLLKDSLEMVEFNLNLVRSIYQTPETANYTKNGYDSSQEHISKTMFDAQQ